MQSMRNYLMIVLGFLALSLVSCGDDEASDAEIAQRYCSLEQQCFPDDFVDYWDSVDECVDAVLDEAEWAKDDSPDCYKAAKSFFECLSKLSCNQLNDYWEEPTENYPCASQERNADRVCD